MCHELVIGVIVQFRGGAELLQSTFPHYTDALAECLSVDRVVGDKDDCRLSLPVEQVEIVTKFFPKHRIKRSKRFIKQPDGSILGDELGQSRPLTLAAGQLMGQPIGQFPQSQQLKDRRDGERRVRVRRNTDVLGYGHLGVQRSPLGQQADTPPGGRPVVDIDRVQLNRPGTRRFQPGDEPQ